MSRGSTRRLPTVAAVGRRNPGGGTSKDAAEQAVACARWTGGFPTSCKGRETVGSADSPRATRIVHCGAAFRRRRTRGAARAVGRRSGGVRRRSQGLRPEGGRLVSDVVEQLTTGSPRRGRVSEEQWARGEEASTEDLRSHSCTTGNSSSGCFLSESGWPATVSILHRQVSCMPAPASHAMRS